MKPRAVSIVVVYKRALPCSMIDVGFEVVRLCTKDLLLFMPLRQTLLFAFLRCTGPSNRLAVSLCKAALM